MNEDCQRPIRLLLKRRRRQLGMTQEQAAILMGMSRVSYNRTESGTRKIDVMELASLCEALGCTIEDVIDDPHLAQTYRRAGMILARMRPAEGAVSLA
jgi:transcriptional regulator with XRE-family HTH domain